MLRNEHKHCYRCDGFERIGDPLRQCVGIRLIGSNRMAIDLGDLRSKHEVWKALVWIKDHKGSKRPAEEILLALFPGWKSIIEQAVLELLADEVRE